MIVTPCFSAMAAISRRRFSGKTVPVGLCNDGIV